MRGQVARAVRRPTHRRKRRLSGRSMLSAHWEREHGVARDRKEHVLPDATDAVNSRKYGGEASTEPHRPKWSEHGPSGWPSRLRQTGSQANRPAAIFVPNIRRPSIFSNNSALCCPNLPSSGCVFRGDVLRRTGAGRFGAGRYAGGRWPGCGACSARLSWCLWAWCS